MELSGCRMYLISSEHWSVSTFSLSTSLMLQRKVQLDQNVPDLFMCSAEHRELQMVFPEPKPIILLPET